MKKYLLLITKSPHHPNTKKALIFAKQKLDQGTPVLVFFYADGAYIANRLMGQTADVENIQTAWIELAKKYGLKLPVCVSTALARGITDAQNAQRHGLLGDNLHPDFELVGLADLAMQLDDDTQLQQF